MMKTKKTLNEAPRRIARAIRLCAVAAATCLLVASCDTPATKQKLAEAQTLNDSLMLETLRQQNEIADLVTTFGEVSAKLDEINGVINVAGVEENTELPSQRDRLMAQLQDVQRRIEEKQEALEKLQRQYSAALGQNKELKKTIERMQGEIAGYVAKIQEYEAQIQDKNRRIEQLSSELTTAQDSINTVTTIAEGQKTALATQDKMLNSGYYIIASTKELKAMGLIKKGVFTAARITPSTFDTSVFHQIDIREVTEIPLGSKDAKILSAMPDTSYELVKDYDRTLKIVITDPASFWSITRYLVVQI